MNVCYVGAVGILLGLAGGGCALHADMVEMQERMDQVAKAQGELRAQLKPLPDRLTDLEARMEAVARAAHTGPIAEDLRAIRAEIQSVHAQLQDIDTRLARVEDAPPVAPTSSEAPTPDAPRPAQPPPAVTGLTPTSAFNLAYNDYLSGRYELAIGGFQRLIKDFPSTSQTAAAHYWIGESYYSMRDYPRAIESFQRVLTEFPKSEKVPPALYKMGVTAAETGDVVRARGHLKRVIEEYPASDEAKLAKHKLAELR